MRILDLILGRWYRYEVWVTFEDERVPIDFVGMYVFRSSADHAFAKAVALYEHRPLPNKATVVLCGLRPPNGGVYFEKPILSQCVILGAQ